MTTLLHENNGFSFHGIFSFVYHIGSILQYTDHRNYLFCILFINSSLKSRLKIGRKIVLYIVANEFFLFLVRLSILTREGTPRFKLPFLHTPTLACEWHYCRKFIFRVGECFVFFFCVCYYFFGGGLIVICLSRSLFASFIHSTISNETLFYF